jgi:hypothetical protein
MTAARFAAAGGMVTGHIVRRPGRPMFRFAARHTRLYAATLLKIGCRAVQDTATGHPLSFAGCGDAR